MEAEIFGIKHIIGTSFILLLIFGILFFLLKKERTETFHNNVLKVTAVFLLSLEIAKITYIVVTKGSLPPYMYPMQLCSMSLYAMPVIAFGRGKVRTNILPFAYAVSLISGILVLLLPTTVLGNSYFWFPFSENILPYHSFFYHGTMIFFSLYLVFSKIYKPKFKDSLKAMLTLLLIAPITGIANLFLDTDYMFLRTGKGNPIQFILLDHGYIIYIIFMMLAFYTLVSLSFLPFIKKEK